MTAYNNYINLKKKKLAGNKLKSCLKHFKSLYENAVTRSPTLIFKQHEVRRSTDTVVCEVQHSQLTHSFTTTLWISAKLN